MESQKSIIVERRGQSHVVVLSVEAYERLLQSQQEPDDWLELVRQARAQIEADLGGRTLPPPEEVLAQIREKLDEQRLTVR